MNIKNRKNLRALLFLSISITLPMMACEDLEEVYFDFDTRADDEAVPRFATAKDLSDSLLAEIDSAERLQNSRSIRYPVCIYSQNQPANSKDEANVLSWTQTCMNEWIAPLQGQPGWRVKNVQTYRVQASGSKCPKTDKGLNVLEIVLRKDNNTSAYEPGFLIWLGSKDGVNKLSILHEMGHCLGLGDLYKYPNGNYTPIGSPPSVMNNCYQNPSLTKDDVAGVRFLWARLQGESRQCPSGYVTGKCNGSWCNTELFCVPNGSGGDGGGGGDGGATIETSKSTYTVGQKVIVEYSGLPGNRRDWIGLFETNASDTNYIDYRYTRGSKNGEVSFGSLSAGSYEARLYFNDSYKVEKKYKFNVTR